MVQRRRSLSRSGDNRPSWVRQSPTWPRRFPPFDRAAVTMTAELCDCYPTKAEGVLAVLATSAQALGNRPLSVWGIDGRFAAGRDPAAAGPGGRGQLAGSGGRGGPACSRRSRTDDRYRLDHDRHHSARQGQSRRPGPDRHQASADQESLVYAGIRPHAAVRWPPSFRSGKGRPSAWPPTSLRRVSTSS